MSKPPIQTSTYHENKIFTIFYFEKAGDILKKHTHDFNTVHTSEVLKGSFRLITDKYDKEIFEKDFIDFEIGECHEFISLEDKSVLLNRGKNEKKVIENDIFIRGQYKKNNIPIRGQ